MVLSATGRIAQVTALANCPAGAQAQIRVELELGIVSGVGQTIGECTGGLLLPGVVPAFGRDSFLTGAGQAVADAVVKNRGQIIEVEEWIRQLSLLAINAYGNFLMLTAAIAACEVELIDNVCLARFKGHGKQAALAARGESRE